MEAICPSGTFEFGMRRNHQQREPAMLRPPAWEVQPYGAELEVLKRVAFVCSCRMPQRSPSERLAQGFKEKGMTISGCRRNGSLTGG